MRGRPALRDVRHARRSVEAHGQPPVFEVERAPLKGDDLARAQPVEGAEQHHRRALDVEVTGPLDQLVSETVREGPAEVVDHGPDLSGRQGVVVAQQLGVHVGLSHAAAPAPAAGPVAIGEQVAFGLRLQDVGLVHREPEQSACGRGVLGTRLELHRLALDHLAVAHRLERAEHTAKQLLGDLVGTRLDSKCGVQLADQASDPEAVTVVGALLPTDLVVALLVVEPAISDGAERRAGRQARGTLVLLPVTLLGLGRPLVAPGGNDLRHALACDGRGHEASRRATGALDPLLADRLAAALSVRGADADDPARTDLALDRAAVAIAPTGIDDRSLALIPHPQRNREVHHHFTVLRFIPQAIPHTRPIEPGS